MPEPSETESRFNGTVRDIKNDDIEQLPAILEYWVRDSVTQELIPDEVNKIIATIKSSIAGQDGRRYVVAENNVGQVVGVMGMQTPSDEMMEYATPGETTTELINAFAEPTQRGRGAGRAMVTKLEEMAHQVGCTELIVNSGPRYEKTGWPFWKRLYGEPVAIAESIYGPGVDAPVWRKSLITQQS